MVDVDVALLLIVVGVGACVGALVVDGARRYLRATLAQRASVVRARFRTHLALRASALLSKSWLTEQIRPLHIRPSSGGAKHALVMQMTSTKLIEQLLNCCV